jgi:hypothetical protein
MGVESRNDRPAYRGGAEVFGHVVWRLAKGQAHLAETIHVETVTHKQSYSSFFLNGFVE